MYIYICIYIYIYIERERERYLQSARPAPPRGLESTGAEERESQAPDATKGPNEGA